MGSSQFHDMAFYLCEASVVLENLLRDERVGQLETDQVLDARDFLKRLNEYLAVDKENTNTDEAWKL